MTVGEFSNFWRQPTTQRTNILNLLSLNVSDTALATEIQLPSLVREVGWAQTLLTTTTASSQKSPPYKPVEKYILFSMAHSFTDFHIDFGGSSVFYHLVKGRKTFYCIEPTDSNLALFEGWLGEDSVAAAPNFFGDRAEGCFEVNLLEGQLLFIPSGWIHAVWTPVDSVAVGGNFLHTFGAELQGRIQQMEDRVGEPEKFRFPGALNLARETAAHYYSDLLACPNETLSPMELRGAGALATFLQESDPCKTKRKQWERLAELVNSMLLSA